MTDTEKHNTALTDLIQLPDGNWIDPARVIGLEYRPFDTGPGYPPDGAKDRVIIKFPEGADMARFDDAIAAVEFRDELARKANAAKAELRRMLDVGRVGAGATAWSESQYVQFCAEQGAGGAA